MEHVKNFLKNTIGFTNNTEELQLKRQIAIDQDYKENVDLQICWILDITGSMSSSISACKSASARCAEIIAAQGYNVGFVMSTYTESSKGSYVSYDRFHDVSEAVKMIKSIQLCVPPHMPSVNAGGDDGDENLKHALAEFSSRHNFDIPSVVFIITDAGYHKIQAGSATAKREREKLKELNVENDIWKIYNTWNKQSTFTFPLLVSNPWSFNDYGILANDTEGVLFQFKRLTSSGAEMAKVQTIVVNEIFQKLSGG